MKRTKPARRLLVDRSEAAELLGCHPMFIKQLADTGRLPIVKFNPGRTAKHYYRLRDLEAMIDANVVTAE